MNTEAIAQMADAIVAGQFEWRGVDEADARAAVQVLSARITKASRAMPTLDRTDLIASAEKLAAILRGATAFADLSAAVREGGNLTELCAQLAQNPAPISPEDATAAAGETLTQLCERLTKPTS